MSWDIYGNPLRPGHCEAHPDIAQPFPCSICRQAQEQEKLERIHDARAQEFHERKTEERKKLRDQFAAAALQGLLAGAWRNMLAGAWRNSEIKAHEAIVKEAYQLADAMLQECDS